MAALSEISHRDILVASGFSWSQADNGGTCRSTMAIASGSARSRPIGAARSDPAAINQRLVSLRLTRRGEVDEHSLQKPHRIGQPLRRNHSSPRPRRLGPRTGTPLPSLESRRRRQHHEPPGQGWTPLPQLQSRQPGRVRPVPAQARPRIRLVPRRRPRRPRLREVARPTSAPGVVRRSEPASELATGLTKAVNRQPRWSLVSDLAGRFVFPQPEIGVVCTFASKRGLIVTPTAQHDQTGGEDPEQQRGHGRPVRVGGRVSRVCGCSSNVIVISSACRPAADHRRRPHPPRVLPHRPIPRRETRAGSSHGSGRTAIRRRDQNCAISTPPQLSRSITLSQHYSTPATDPSSLAAGKGLARRGDVHPMCTPRRKSRNRIRSPAARSATAALSCASRCLAFARRRSGVRVRRRRR